MDLRGAVRADVLSLYKLTTPLSAPIAMCLLETTSAEVMVPSSLEKRSMHRCVLKSKLYTRKECQGERNQ